MAMNVNERIRFARIIEKMERNKEFSKKIGIRDISECGKARGKRGEIYRC